ncbi:MAG: hypothetical protein ABI623_10880, partial [bacterium]
QTDKGKAVPKKVGLAPIQREGMDYEFDIVFDLDLNHNAISSKDRSSLFDGKVLTKPTEEVGTQIVAWLNRNNTLTSTSNQQPSTTKVSSSVNGRQPVSQPQSQPKTQSQPKPQSNSQPKPQPQPASPRLPAEVPTSLVGTQEGPPLFDNNGHKLGEKETEAMLFAVKHAPSVERLFSIEQSMSKGMNAKKITSGQAEKVKKAIQERSTTLAQQKAA